MYAQDVSVQAVAPTAAPPPRLTRPLPERRVVESTARASPRTARPVGQPADLPAAISELSASARQFAEVLETTGSISIAASVSGFVMGGLNLYG